MITLYSMVICPFAQRTRIQLALKDVPFDLVNLDITKPRPDWFLALNPKGQVPVLAIDDETYSESAEITHMLADRYPGVDGDETLDTSAINAFIESDLIPALYRLMASRSLEAIEKHREAALAVWRKLDELLGDLGYTEGFIGDSFGVPEILAAPFILRFEVVEYYQGFRVPDEPEYRRVLKWRDAMLGDPVVRSTAEPMPDLIKMYEDYTLGSFNGAVPEGKARSSLDLSDDVKARAMPAPFV